MQQAERDPQPRLISRVFSRPASKLGWAVAAAMVGAIVLVFLFNAVAAQGTEDEPEAHGAVFVGILLCLLGSWVMGLVAVFRRHERSWVVLLPTTVLSLAVANEVVQGLLHLVGRGG